AVIILVGGRSEKPTSTEARRRMGEASAQSEERKGFELPSHLTAIQKLGSGAYGEVYLCEDSRNGSQVAVKWIRNFTQDPLCGKRILREIRLLAALRHENLLRLLDLPAVPDPDFDDVYIVMPYLHLDLHRVIYSKMKLSESHCQAFVCQILRGLKYLHSAGVAHRDLKPSNILVNKDCALRIADFGLARGRSNSDEELTDYVVTRWYRAPELMLLPCGYFEAVDLWSVGCIHFELMAREVLFPGKDHLDMLKRIAATLGFSMENDLGWVPEKDMAQ
ncbi:Mitogen-activated protein kinase 13 (AtMPK13) (MAP kinase 13), partial [Durusdinium trenchii]